MNGKKCYILDFDGTVTALDTLVVAFDKYCIVDWRELENEMRAGRKERHQTLVDEVESMKAEKEELFDFVKKVRENGDEIVILSGGFRSFAELFMGDTEVEAYINDIRYLGDKNWELIPCRNALPPLCSKNCSNCKRAVVEKYKNEGFETIYFGDGETDFCGSRYADKIYATDELAEKLASENVKFTYFKDYKDIL